MGLHYHGRMGMKSDWWFYPAMFASFVVSVYLIFKG